jgi:hypothetical protein
MPLYLKEICQYAVRTFNYAIAGARSRGLYVVTSGLNPVRLVYRGLGASYVIHSRSGDISFVL